MNGTLNYEEIQQVDWKEAIRLEGQCSIVREIGEGWWLFEKSPDHGKFYHGLLGWNYNSYGDTHRYFAIHDPAKVVAYHAPKFGYEQDKSKSFTDGRQVKQVTRAFLPPLARDYAKMAIQQIGALNQDEIAELERIHSKLENLLHSGSAQHKAAMRVAKGNRDILKKKWKIPSKKVIAPAIPENVSATVNLLNGHT